MARLPSGVLAIVRISPDVGTTLGMVIEPPGMSIMAGVMVVRRVLVAISNTETFDPVAAYTRLESRVIAITPWGVGLLPRMVSLARSITSVGAPDLNKRARL